MNQRPKQPLNFQLIIGIFGYCSFDHLQQSLLLKGRNAQHSLRSKDEQNLETPENGEKVLKPKKNAGNFFLLLISWEWKVARWQMSKFNSIIGIGPAELGSTGSFQHTKNCIFVCVSSAIICTNSRKKRILSLLKNYNVLCLLWLIDVIFVIVVVVVCARVFFWLNGTRTSKAYEYKTTTTKSHSHSFG